MVCHGLSVHDAVNITIVDELEVFSRGPTQGRSHPLKIPLLRLENDERGDHVTVGGDSFNYSREISISGLPFLSI
jgi:hypothetical protein